MYRTIYVPVDNSDHSNVSIDLAVAIGAALGSELVGSHVYAAKLHDVRFKQMEFTLPDEYKEEEELEKQRKIHDALIARGLHLISDSYLDLMETRCTEKSLPFTRKHFDGKNFEAIVADVQSSSYDLVILGALGMGAVKDSQVGSVCERVVRRITSDVLVVRDLEVKDGTSPGAIVVGLDGSPRSYGGLRAALGLARAFDKTVHVVAIAEQDDDALLEAHLEAARSLGERQGVKVETTLGSGPVRRTLAEKVTALKPWLLVLGRTGLDKLDDKAADVATDTVPELGAIAEHFVRHGAGHVLLSGRTFDIAAALSEDAAA